MEPYWNEIKSRKINEETAQELLNAYLADKEPKDETMKTTFKVAERLNAQIASYRQSSLQAISKHALSVYRSPRSDKKALA